MDVKILTNLGQFLQRLRVEEKRTSLTKLERETGKNRAEIRRWERGEDSPTLQEARNLAKAYQLSARETKTLLDLQKKALTQERTNIRLRAQRRRECTVAQKHFDVRLRFAPLSTPSSLRLSVPEGIQSTGLSIELGPLEPGGSMLVAYIYEKKTSRQILCVHNRDVCFYYAKSTKEKGIFCGGEEALRELIRYCSERALGKYSLLDLIVKTVQKSELLNPKTLGTSSMTEVGPSVLVTIRELEEISKMSHEILKEKEEKMRRFWVEKIDVHLKHYRARSTDDLPQIRDLLLKRLQIASDAITAYLNDPQ